MHTAEEGTNFCRTAGAQEDLAMGKTSGKELRRKEDVFKATAESCYNKH